MINVAIRLWPRGESGEPLAFDIFSLTRVPCVGEHVSHVADEGLDTTIYRVARVLHFFEPGDGGRMAEIDAVLDREHGF